MGTIRESNGRFNVQIRKKGNFFSKSFSDKETALLYAKYKEDLIDEMVAFDVPKDEMITLRQAFAIKMKDLEEKGSERKSIIDLTTNINLLDESLDLPLSKLDYNFWVELLDKWKSLHGKNRSEKISIYTILRRFAIMAAVYSKLIEMGVNVNNDPQKITTMIRQTIKKDK